MDISSEDLELGSDGRMCHTQPKDIRPEKVGRDENEQEINNKCLKCSREFNNLEDLRVHENNCYICEQCNNWYEHKKDLEYHIRKRHKGYNCDQCDNGYRSQEDLEDHRNEINSMCKENLDCRKEREKQNSEYHRYEFKCDLCNKKFKDKNELVEHWETNHEVQIYECVHLQCRIKYICQKTWKEHMKEKHRIGFNCPQCNEYHLFEEHLEEHTEDEHMEREEYIETNGFQCVECNEFFESVEVVIDHENEGECDQCGKWLGCENNMQIYKQKEHKTISKKDKKEKQIIISNKESLKGIITIKDKDLINEISPVEKFVTEKLETEFENPERDKKPIRKQDRTINKQCNKEKQEIYTKNELAQNKKNKKVINSKIITEKNDFIKKIPKIGKNLPNIIEFKGKSPERDQKTNGKQDKLNKITKKFPLDMSNVKQKSEWINLKEIKNFHNTILDKDTKKGNTFKPNTKTYRRKKRYIMVFYVPKFTIDIHSNTRRKIEVKNLYHKEQEINKFRNLEIWKLLDIKNTYYKGN